MFGGLFGKPAGQAVAQLATLRTAGREFLLAVHEEGQLRCMRGRLGRACCVHLLIWPASSITAARAAAWGLCPALVRSTAGSAVSVNNQPSAPVCHAGRVWDVEHKRLVYGADLLPPSAAAMLVPKHVAVAGARTPSLVSLLHRCQGSLCQACMEVYGSEHTANTHLPARLPTPTFPPYSTTHAHAPCRS